MKLFVWANPYSVDYGSSLLIAVAETVEEAKEIAGNSCSRYACSEFEEGQNDMQSTAATLGEPSRILDLPCAEWHEWSE